MDANLDVSTIFKALSKPATLMGVDYDYAVIAGTFVILMFIFTDKFEALLLFFPLHLIGWILCRIDPHIFKIILMKASIGRVRNFTLWRCQSYSEF